MNIANVTIDEMLCFYHSIEGSTKLCITPKSQLYSLERTTSQAWHHKLLRAVWYRFCQT